MSGTTMPRLALTIDAAADSLSVGTTWFRKNVLPEVKVIRRASPSGRGRIVLLVPVVELERWIAQNAAVPLEVDL